MTDQDPFARTPQSGEPAHSAGPVPRDGSTPGGVRYDDPQSGTATMPRTEQHPSSGWNQPTGQHWQPGPASGTPAGPPPPTNPWSTGGGGDGGGHGGRRRRSPLLLAAAALAALLVAGGVGGAVGYEAASSGSGSGSSVLSGSGSSDSSSTASPAAAGSVEAVAQKVLPSVVQLRGASGEGSGIVISADGLILTNAHVLEAGQAQQQSSGGLGGLGGLLGGGQQQQQQAAPQLQAVFQDGRTAQVQVVGTDATADLAVVRAVGASGLTPVEIGSSSGLQVGQGVVAVGSPLGLSGTVTTGIVSALNRPVVAGGEGSGQSTVTDAIQTDAAINPGNSGGALVDMNGRVVGITSSIATLGGSSGSGQQQSGSIGLGFAIPIDQAKRIGDQLAQQGFANQAVMGVQVASGQQGATTTGATIAAVTPGGPAAGAGVAQGDVVTKVNDRVIDDGDALVAAVRAQDPGSQVTLTVQTGNAAPRQVQVTLGSERAPSS